jgi:hypothetical protein
MTAQIIKSETKINNILFWICFFITILAIAMTLLAFFSHDEYPPTSISLFYVGVLAIYSLHKEAIRFLDQNSKEQGKKQRKGELFVYFWIIMTAVLYAINFLSKNQYSHSLNGNDTSGLITATYLTLEVGAVFIISRILKLLMIKFFEKNEKQ